MEKELKNLKVEMRKEFESFTFTKDMERNILRKTQTSKKKSDFLLKRTKLFPTLLTIALTAIFFSGIYQVIMIQWDQDRRGNPNVIENKPVLVTPTYIPEGYTFKHTRTLTNEELYEHVFVHNLDENEYFIYRMQGLLPDLDTVQSKNIPITPTILGSMFQLSSTHKILLWEDEGFYQMVEQKGTLSELEFLKITDSILKEKGHISYLEKNIKKLESAKGY